MKEENIVKNVCKELGFTYKQLGEAIGYSEGAIKTAVSTDKVSEPMQKAIELYLKNLELQKELEQFKQFKDFIKSIK